jgi:hypothetical protein
VSHRQVPRIGANANILLAYAEAKRRRPGRKKRMRQFGKVDIPQQASSPR